MDELAAAAAVVAMAVDDDWLDDDVLEDAPCAAGADELPERRFFRTLETFVSWVEVSSLLRLYSFQGCNCKLALKPAEGVVGGDASSALPSPRAVLPVLPEWQAPHPASWSRPTRVRWRRSSSLSAAAWAAVGRS